MGSRYEEEGTAISGYAENGPYHCEDCIHRQGKRCYHPIVAIDPAVKKGRESSGGWVEINIEKGCCRYVNPNPNPVSDSSSLPKALKFKK